MIFDETGRLAGPIGCDSESMLSRMGNTITPKRLGGNTSEWGVKDGGWSRDNGVEIEKGWIRKADTIAALARDIGGEMRPEALAETVARWNGFCDAGVDSDFGRTDRSGMTPTGLGKIETPPFYAIEIWPGGFSTCGGPKKNAEGQVMDVFGRPIARLYEAGSMGHTCGQVYAISGANYCECFVWGRISGRNVAALKSWG
jgi:hypothetical protein